MNSFIIHRVKEIKIKKPNEFMLNEEKYYWQTIEVITLDGYRVEILLESVKPLLKESEGE